MPDRRRLGLRLRWSASPSAVVAVALAAAVTVLGRATRQPAGPLRKKLAADQSLLSVVPQDPGDLDAFVARYQQLANIAPLTIDDEWHTIADLVKAVATSDLSDPTTADRLRDQAVAAMKAVDDVRAYAKTTCGVDLVLAPTPGAVTPTTRRPGRRPPRRSDDRGTGPDTGQPPTLPGTVPPTVP
jgi:hypothetical protein